MTSINWKYKAAGVFVLALVLCAMAYTIKVQHDMLKAQQEHNKELVQLKDNIAKIEATQISRDEFNDFTKTLNMDLTIIQEDVDKVNGKIDGALVVKTTTPGGVYTGIGSSGTIPIPSSGVTSNTNGPTGLCDNCQDDPNGYYRNIQYLQLEEPMTKGAVPFGTVYFNATESKPWSYTVHPRTYSTSIVLSTDPSGRRTAYSKMSITPHDGTNKTYDMPVTESTFVEVFPEPSFHWFNPKVTLGLDLGWASDNAVAAGPALQLFFMSYGKTKPRPDWLILGAGLAHDSIGEAFSLALTPFAYKPTSDTSMFQNLYIGPTISITQDGIVNVLGGLRLTL